MFTRSFCLGLTLFALAAIHPLAAAPITYVETGQLSGTLGTAPLSNVDFTFTFYGDTNNITGINPLLNLATSNSIALGTLTGSFTSAVSAGTNPTAGIVGFSGETTMSAITILASGATGYNLASPISVFSATPYFARGSFSTTLGLLTVTEAQNVTFTATLADTPEPGSMLMAAGGLFAVIALKSRRVI